MAELIFRRLGYGLLVMAGVLLLVFFLFHILPADPARMMLGQRADISSVEAINRELGRDQTLAMQLVHYLNDLSPVSWHQKQDSLASWYADSRKYGTMIALPLTGDRGFWIKAPYLRRSYQTQERVSVILLDALPGTLVLSLAALIFATVTGIGLGTLAAFTFQKWPDRLSLILSVAGMALPSFFAGIITAWLFGFVWADYTGLAMSGGLYVLDPFEGETLTLKNLILPALTLGIRPLAIITQLTRSSLLEVMSADFIRTARAKGLSPFTVWVRHGLRNSLNPVLTAVSGWLGSLLAGAVFIEYIFGWKGLGKVTVDALEHYDFPVVMGAVLMISFFFIIINILVDILYAKLDPRVRK